MKKFLLSLLMASLTLSALEFHSYDEARSLQKESHKIIMIDVIRTDCHYCVSMNRDVLQDADMTKYLEEKFIPVKINLDNEKLPLGIKVNFTPSFFFINAEEKIIKTIPGSWSKEDFKELTKNIK